MSLYNLIHGQNPLADMLLALIGIPKDVIPRYRDVWWDAEAAHIVVHTRTGGGNRDDYEADNDHLATFQGFVSDCDDDGDCTYANFSYTLPEKFAHLRPWLDERGERPASERWADALRKIQTGSADDPDVKRVMEALKPMFEAIAGGESGTVVKV